MANEEVHGTSAHRTDTPYAFLNDDAEWARLDGTHRGITEYLHGELCTAPLEDPHNILDLGAGSGAWAIHAANTYPAAQVTAADISPMPARPYPPNVQTIQLNLLLPLTLPEESYDIIHLRLVLFHLPNPQTVLTRITRLLAPAGHLLIEDLCLPQHDPATLGPAQALYDSVCRTYMAQHALVADTGARVGAYMRETGVFARVEEREVALVLNPLTDDPDTRELAAVMRRTVLDAMTGRLAPELVALGLSDAVKAAWRAEMTDGTEAHRWVTPLYFVWGRKAG
ncbi:S-adenosyl-L-methionine-dependent methyltransferase [Dentipellis sp. KUC8613]|nr:S-adenosyl-L-methionine-dependent methyltransferase [Dentipellis sp. KUC8613]